VRLVCIDHFFEQDIDALEHAAGRNRCWPVPYEPFLELARNVFPEEVFTGIEAYFEPRLEQKRRHYAALADRELKRLHRTYRFDALLAPSDTFFWIRALIGSCRRLGFPFIVLQKEATIPPGWLEGPAEEWGRISPFIGDHMLVSSDHHARFWIASGVEPERITVTGQPRFDVYARPAFRRSWHELGVETDGLPTVLFLTYDSSAYLPVIDRKGMAPWLELRTQTEQVLLDIAAAGEARMLVKAHPQPAEDQRRHLAELAGNGGVVVLDALGDVRQYILNADVVVGFQTTALLESLAAGRPTIYTWWTENALLYTDDLIPFHREGDALMVADSPDALRVHIRDGLAGRHPERRSAERLVTHYLGPVDGGSAERCWRTIEQLATDAAPTTEGASLRRQHQGVQLAAASSAVARAPIWAVSARFPELAYAAHRVIATVRGRSAIDRRAFERDLKTRSRWARDRIRAALSRPPS
jgi:hypothetical protein